MSFSVQVVDPLQWGILSEVAHLSVFGEKRPHAMERIDYALLLVDQKNVPAAWITCHELDRTTVYWQFGGATPAYAKTVHVARGYSQLIDWAAHRYTRICTRIENRNYAMLKLALRLGFFIVGTRMSGTQLFVELTRETEGT